jgi:hypothetical protein
MLCGVLACSSLDTANSVEIVDGVTHIRNNTPVWGAEPKVKLELVQKIGELEGDDENYQLYQPSDVVRDSDGNIYILELGNARIQKFDENGRYLKTIGRKGQGPGEIQQALKMEKDAADNLYVYDLGNMRIQIFSAEGEDLGSHRFTKPGSFFRLRSDNSYAVPYLVFEPGNKQPKRVGVFEISGNELFGFGEVTDQDDDPIRNRMKNTIFFDIDAGDNTYLTYSVLNKIEKYGPAGTLLTVFDRPLAFKTTDEPVVKILDFMNMSREVPIYNSISFTLEIDGKGRLWILTPTKSMQDMVANIDTLNMKNMGELGNTDMSEFHIFDSEGYFLGAVQVGNPSGTIKIYDDRLYMIDLAQEMCVKEYRIVEIN